MLDRKFVDDVKAREKCHIDDSTLWISTSKQKRMLTAAGCQRFYDSVVRNAREKGMVVNGMKTQLLCISPSIYSKVDACIEVD